MFPDRDERSAQGAVGSIRGLGMSGVGLWGQTLVNRAIIWMSGWTSCLAQKQTSQPLQLQVHLNGFDASFGTLACLHLGFRSNVADATDPSAGRSAS